MKLLKSLTLVLMAAVIFLAVVNETSAEISNAAVLFLRIAPGARPAGMGESFVAIADDATATHWNPAGLGSFPLADTWKEARIPDKLKPIKALAALKKEGGKGHLAYDLWTVTPRGIARYDNKEWYLGEVFTTRTDETVLSKVKAYFNIEDEQQLKEIVKKVARVNNDESFEHLKQLRDTVMAMVPESYSHLETLKSDFDTVLAGYDRCLVNWSKIKEVSDRFKDGMKDGQLSEQDIDRISFAVEKSRTRFIPEELMIPYSAVLKGQPFDIANSLELLLVATTENLYAFDGRRWRPLQTASDTLDYGLVHTLYGLDRHILVGTENGLVVFSGARLRPIGNSEQLPVGAVTAIGAKDLSNIWIVLNNDLYHYDGSNWTNTRPYTVELDDTPEIISDKFNIYGTQTEKEQFLAKLTQANQDKIVVPVEPETAEGGRKGLLELMDEMKRTDTSAVTDTSSTGDEETTDESSDSASDEAADELASANEPAAQPVADTQSATETAPETSEGADTEVVADSGAVLEQNAPTAVNQSPTFTVSPGDRIVVPYLASIKGAVNAIHVEMNEIWLGTEHGIVHFDGDKWEMPGYRDTVFESQTSIDEFVGSRVLSDSSKMDSFRLQIVSVNDIEGEYLESGSRVKLPRNPAAAGINEIGRRENKLYFATTQGLIEYDGESWSRSDLKDMGETNAIDIRSIDNELWVASDESVIIKANGRIDISTMYVKWLPELADDLYYAFLAGVFPKSGWGTFGGNVTFISYGSFTRTGPSPASLGEFDSFDVAFTVSFGAPLTNKLAGGVSAKGIYSKLSDQGAGTERGKGTSTGFAIDLGLLYNMTSRLTWGLAITNLGPQMTYIDASQADDLPRNFALGFSYKLLQKDFYRFLVTAEMNKLLVGVDDGLSQELKETIFNGGAEFMYANIFAVRGGYVYDQEGNVKSLTLGAGLTPLQNMRFDFSYIPSNSSSVLSNTLRLSLSIVP